MPTATAITTSFDEILVATDFTQQSDKALKFAVSLAHDPSAELLLVHVAEPVSTMTVPESAWFDDPLRLKRIDEELEGVAIRLRSEGLRVKSLSSFGGLSDEIGRAAENCNANAIVLGTHGRHGLAHLLLGSKAESIAHELSIPALIIGPLCALQQGVRWWPHNMVCAVELTYAGAKVAAFAIMLATQYGASLSIAYEHSNATKDAFPGWPEFHSAIVDLVSAERSDVGAPVRPFRLQNGGEAGQVNELVSSRHADLIILSIDHRLFNWPGLATGTLPKLLSEATCPVMTVPRVHETCVA